MKKKRNKDSKESNVYFFARYSGLAFEMLGIIVLGSWGGHKLDQVFSNNFPLWTIILSLGSVFAALYLVLKDIIKNGNKPK